MPGQCSSQQILHKSHPPVSLALTHSLIFIVYVVNIIGKIIRINEMCVFNFDIQYFTVYYAVDTQIGII